MPPLRPAPGDWMVPAGVVALGLVEAARGTFGPPTDTAVALTLVVVCCAALLVRRHASTVVFLLVAMALTGQSPLGVFPDAMAGTALFAVAAFACGRYGSRPWAYTVLPVGAAAVAATTVLDPEDGLARSWIWTIFVVPVFVLGAWFRQQRMHAEREARERVRAAAAEERVRLDRRGPDQRGDRGPAARDRGDGRVTCGSSAGEARRPGPSPPRPDSARARRLTRIGWEFLPMSPAGRSG
ncbi:DUF7134 domain-containing protein [Actinoplanes subglobosus]